MCTRMVERFHMGCRQKTGEWGGGDRQGIEFLFFPQKYYADNGEFHGSQLEFMIAVKH